MSPQIFRQELENQSHTAPPTGPPYPLNPPRQDRRDSGVSAALRDGAINTVVLGSPMGRPYPPNSPGGTGRIRGSPPLCGEELEVQSYPTPPRESQSPKRPLCGEELEVPSHPNPLTGGPGPPNGPRTTGMTRVYPRMCGE